MKHDEDERDLDHQIQQELRRLKDATGQETSSFSTHEELQALFKRLPIRKKVRNLPLSYYLRQTRTALRATAEVFAAVLNLSTNELVELESKQMLPWTIDPRVIAQVAEGLRLHMTALQLLAKHSHTIAFVSRQLPDPDLAKQQMVDWLEEVKVQLKQRGAADLLH